MSSARGRLAVVTMALVAAVGAQAVEVARPRLGVCANGADDQALGALAARVAERIGADVVPLAEIAGDPAAPRALRRLAFESDLEALLVIPSPKPDNASERFVLYSGHSGGALERGRLPDVGSVAALDELAVMLAARLVPEAVSLPGVAAPGATADHPPIFGLAAGEGPLRIDAETLELRPRPGGGRDLLFARAVKVRRGTLSLEADRLEARYGPEGGEPERLIARGDVRVQEGARRARCRTARYERASEMLICEGDAELLSGCDVVRGQAIHFDLGADRARVMGAASVEIGGAGTGAGCGRQP